MDQWKQQPDGFFDTSGNSSLKVEQHGKDPISARKIQKADREKLRRDRLNEQFVELGNALDPDRPKNDKATILTDTVQMLKDLTTQVNKLKSEHVALSEESRELTQEKNELREEKATLKSEIDNLNAQYQQRLRCVYPWATMDPSVVMGPPLPYPYPMPIPIPSAPIPIHSAMQPYPFFRNQTPGAVPNPCTPYGPYTAPSNPQVDHSSSQQLPHSHPSSTRSQNYNQQDNRNRPADVRECSGADRSDEFSDVVTELELKTPGSAGTSPQLKAAQDKDSSSKERIGKQWPHKRKGSGNVDESSSSRCSSLSVLRRSSSDSVGDGSVAND